MKKVWKLLAVTMLGISMALASCEVPESEEDEEVAAAGTATDQTGTQKPGDQTGGKPTTPVGPAPTTPVGPAPSNLVDKDKFPPTEVIGANGTTVADPVAGTPGSSTSITTPDKTKQNILLQCVTKGCLATHPADLSKLEVANIAGTYNLSAGSDILSNPALQGSKPVFTIKSDGSFTFKSGTLEGSGTIKKITDAVGGENAKAEATFVKGAGIFADNEVRQYQVSAVTNDDLFFLRLDLPLTLECSTCSFASSSTTALSLSHFAGKTISVGGFRKANGDPISGLSFIFDASGGGFTFGTSGKGTMTIADEKLTFTVSTAAGDVPASANMKAALRNVESTKVTAAWLAAGS